MKIVFVSILVAVVGVVSFFTAFVINRETRIAEAALKTQALKNEYQKETARQHAALQEQFDKQNQKRVACLKEANDEFHKTWDRNHKVFYPWIKDNGLPVDLGNSLESAYSEQAKHCQLSFDSHMRMLESASIISQGR